MMDKEDLKLKSKKSVMEGRAVMAGVITATVFLCFFTLFEIFIIKMEWNVPVMNVFFEDSDKYLFAYERKEEEHLECSTEKETETQLLAENKCEETLSTQSELIENNDTENLEDTEPTEMLQISDSEVEQVTETELEVGTEEEIEEKNLLPYYIKINRQQNVITIYEADDNDEYTVPVKAILCSTGLYNATPKGVFHLSSKYIWRELNGGVYGQYASRITGGVLFHSVPYASKNKSTLYWDKYNKLGQQASMGCVRLTVEDAKWIYDNCPSGTAVEVYDSEDPGPLGKPETLKLDKDNVNKGWDPTDPDEKNPWHEWSEDD